MVHMWQKIQEVKLLMCYAQQEDLSGEPVLKVWALDKPVKKTGMPTCLSSVTIHNGRKQFPVRNPK